MFFGDLLFLLDIISEDYELKGYGKTTLIFLIINLVILFFFIFLHSFWKISTNSNPNVLSWFYNTLIIPESFDIIRVIFWIIVFSLFIILLLFAFLDRKRGRSDYREHSKAIIPWVLFYTIIFVLLRGISAGFIWEDRLKSLSNIIDVFMLYLVLILGVVRVITIPEERNSKEKSLWNPLNWTEGIPKYAKILLLFYLGAIIFYHQLEQIAITVITGSTNTWKFVKLASLAGLITIGIISVFLRFKPKPINDDFPGPFKFIEIQINKLWRKLPRFRKLV